MELRPTDLHIASYLARDFYDASYFSRHMISQVARELARVIRFLCHDGVTVLLIEQNLKLAAEVADRLATMVKGRIVYSASPATFSAEE
jgi:branched-chain amino acid transport system ATP-binding protein